MAMLDQTVSVMRFWEVAKWFIHRAKAVFNGLYMRFGLQRSRWISNPCPSVARPVMMGILHWKMAAILPAKWRRHLRWSAMGTRKEAEWPNSNKFLDKGSPKGSPNTALPV
jgi:hypothetical protein